jgi:hexosaminidase
MIGRRTLLLGLAALALRGQDIIPRPERLTPGAGSYALGAATRIHAGPGARAVAESLREALRPATGLALPVTDGGGE